VLGAEFLICAARSFLNTGGCHAAVFLLRTTEAQATGRSCKA
jgi:hypothetical protein